MKKVINFFALSIVLFLVSACGSSNPAIEQLKEVHAAIQSAQSIDEIYPYITDESREYFEYMTRDTAESIEQRLWLGNNIGLMFTTALLAQPSSDSAGSNSNKSQIFNALKMSRNPLFSASEVLQLDEDLSECCNPAYVTVLMQVERSTFVTKKILFEGTTDDLKLDVLSLLKFDEQIMRQSFAQFKEPELINARNQRDMRRVATLSAQANPNDPACVNFVEAVLAGEFGGGDIFYKL